MCPLYALAVAVEPILHLYNPRLTLLHIMHTKLDCLLWASIPTHKSCDYTLYFTLPIVTT